MQIDLNLKDNTYNLTGCTNVIEIKNVLHTIQGRMTDHNVDEQIGMTILC